MPLPRKLTPADLYNRCDPQSFEFATTDELENLVEFLGQPRAVEAVRFGVAIEREGYNIFAFGPAGVGKHALVRQTIAEGAKDEPAPPDWCYVHNFTEAHKPQALRLPGGLGAKLRRDMEEFVEELRSALPAAFETDEYRTQRQALEEQYRDLQQRSLADIRQRAQARGLNVIQSPGGLAFAPFKDGQVVGPEEFGKLSPEEQRRIQDEVEAVQKEAQEIFAQMPTWEKERREKLRQLNRQAADFALGLLMQNLRQSYGELTQVVEYLNRVQQDIIDNIRLILMPEDGQQEGPGSDREVAAAILRRYQVNVLVDSTFAEGAPVVYEDNPTYANLVGRAEHMAQMGALLTDFTLIKSGALHRANGGYLIVDSRKLLSQPFAWEGLKRVLRSGQIRVESLGQATSLISTVSLEPEPIPLEIKIVIVGEPQHYYLLRQYDPEFEELFKVAADFESVLERNDANEQQYARLIATLAHKRQIRPLNREAVARLIEHSARLSSDSQRLSIQVGSLGDLLVEADHWAGEKDGQIIGQDDIQQAVDAQIYRADRVRHRMQEQILRETVLIDTAGAVVGQINGLAVLQIGGFAFGRPSRITASVRVGVGRVIDIEREVAMGGPSHTKGVLILSSFLAGRYAAERPLSLSASLAFEQSYSGVDGDSASSTELYALMSAIAQVPINQSLAVTGSVNQRGQVQAIGGANEKIEGFFDICRHRGLNGEQGVLIPGANVKHLMLRGDVVAAVAAGQFHIWAVETIDEGIELLTGMAAGEADEAGDFPAATINGRVQRRLQDLAEKRQSFAQGSKEEMAHEEESGDESESEADGEQTVS